MSNVFSLSESEELKKVLKNPEDDLQKIISLLKRKLVESISKISKSEEKYRSLITVLTNIGFGIDIVSKNYEILYQNQVLKELFGDCIGKICYERYMGRDTQCSFCQMEETLKYNEIKSNELKGVDGRIYEIISAPYPNPDGTYDKVLEIVIDITERKIVEQKLRESEEKYRLLTEQSLMGIFIIQQGKFKYINQAVSDINGYSVEEMLNWTGFDIAKTIHSEDVEKIMTSLERSEQGDLEEVSSSNFRIITKSGKIKWVEEFDKRIDFHGKPASMVTLIDSTERIKAQEELVKLNQIKSELLRRTSHELKTPLVSIKGFSELLLEVHRDKLDTFVISTLNEIKQGCLRLESLIGDILKTAELESDVIRIHKSEEDLSFLIRVCVNEIKGLIKLRNHKIVLDLHENLISQFEKEQIHQVISNLLSNAVKYTPPRGKIEIKSDIKENFIVISIKDNGIGFTKQEKTRIFKQFGKIERYGQGMDIIPEGSGFGLFISKKIMKLHGGDIWVESEGRNKGSTFYFSLPIIQK
ncbi:MAG: ATP-binding protein [Promethearchaeota archaeon]